MKSVALNITGDWEHVFPEGRTGLYKFSDKEGEVLVNPEYYDVPKDFFSNPKYREEAKQFGGN